MPKSNERNPIKGKEDRYVEKHHQGSHPITKKEFLTLLTKVSRPVSEWNKLAQVKKGTSVVHPSDGCTDTRKSQDKTEGKEDLQSD